jgi:hypothetical protein
MRNRSPIAGTQVSAARLYRRRETGGVFRTQLGSLHGIMSLSIKLMFFQARALPA